MAEIEHFVDPERKNHHKFHLVKELCIPLYTAKNQMTQERSIIKDMSL